MTLPDFISVEFCLDVVVATLLIVTIVYCAVLHRKLSALRDAEAEMQTLLQQFAGQTKKAETGIVQLREAAEDIGNALGHQVQNATDLLDELKLITATGDDLASRLERGLVREEKPRNSGPVNSRVKDALAPRAMAQPKRSESERALLRALQEAS